MKCSVDIDSSRSQYRLWICDVLVQNYLEWLWASECELCCNACNSYIVLVNYLCGSATNTVLCRLCRLICWIQSMITLNSKCFFIWLFPFPSAILAHTETEHPQMVAFSCHNLTVKLIHNVSLINDEEMIKLLYKKSLSKHFECCGDLSAQLH